MKYLIGFRAISRILTVCSVSLIAIFFSTLDSLAQPKGSWRRLIDKPTYTVFANPKNPATFFVGGGQGKIYRTYDYGKSFDTLDVIPGAGFGKFTNVIVHPVDTSVILLGGIVTGLIRRSTDNGNSWSTVLQREDRITVSSEGIRVNPFNPDEVFFGQFTPPIIFKSIDRGLTWDSLTILSSADGNDSVAAICTLTMKSDSADVLMVGCSDGDVLRSINGGKKWKRVTRLITKYRYSETPRIEFSPRDPKVGYIPMHFLFPGNQPDNGGLFKTTDGGNTWNRVALKDTSLWAVAVRANENETDDELWIGGFSGDGSECDSLESPPNCVRGDSLVQWSEDGGKTRVELGKSIDWLKEFNELTKTFYKNAKVWMMKWIGSHRDNEKLFMATEGGFFVFDSPTNIADDHSAKMSITVRSGHLHLVLADPLTQPTQIVITDVQGRLIHVGTMSMGSEVMSIQVGRLQTGCYTARIGSLRSLFLVGGNE